MAQLLEWKIEKLPPKSGDYRLLWRGIESASQDSPSVQTLSSPGSMIIISFVLTQQLCGRVPRDPVQSAQEAFCNCALVLPWRQRDLEQKLLVSQQFVRRKLFELCILFLPKERNIRELATSCIA